MRSGVLPKCPVYDREVAQRTLSTRYMTDYHRQAQWAEFAKLKAIIGKTHAAFKHPLNIFDIGIGYARIPRLLSKVFTWNKIAEYVGIDISPYCVAQSNRISKRGSFADKVQVIEFDAVRLMTNSDEYFKREEYHLAVCTYFTAGDFQPSGIKLETREDGLIVDYDIDLLRPNRDFIAVFRGAYGLLQEGGKIVIGSIYYDNDIVRKIQEDFYKKCGMTVITSHKDPFTATREGFWSERFNKEKIYDYLSWFPQDKIEIIPLDDYNFASMVVIGK